MSEFEGGTQLQHGVTVSSGSGDGPAFERFAPSRPAAPTPIRTAHGPADPGVAEENARYAAMLDPDLVRQYEAIPQQEQAASARGELRAAPDAEPKLARNQVLLKDGRVVSVMETTPRHDQQVEKVLGMAGLTLTGLGALGYQRAMALCALEDVGRLDPRTGEVDPRTVEPLLVPRTAALWEERLDLIPRTSDVLKIVRKYEEINGG